MLLTLVENLHQINCVILSYDISPIHRFNVRRRYSNLWKFKILHDFRKPKQVHITCRQKLPFLFFVAIARSMTNNFFVFNSTLKNWWSSIGNSLNDSSVVNNLSMFYFPSGASAAMLEFLGVLDFFRRVSYSSQTNHLIAKNNIFKNIEHQILK